MAKTINRGQAITELVKGSIEYTLHIIRTAFHEQYPRRFDDWFWVVDSFTEFIIVKHEEQPPDEYYRVSYTRDGDDFEFAAREDWEVVELSYQPAQQTTEAKEKKSHCLVERIQGGLGLEPLEEARRDKGPWPVQGHGITADIVNYNHHRYRRHVLEAAIREAKLAIQNAPEGTLVLSGELDHPTDKGNQTALLGETVVKWNDIWLDGPKVMIEGKLLGTSKGQDVKVMLDSGLRPDISQRAWGEWVVIEEDGVQVKEITWLTLLGGGYDLVGEGGDPFAQMASESKEPGASPVRKQHQEGVRPMSEKNKGTQTKAEAPTQTSDVAALAAREATQRIQADKLLAQMIEQKINQLSFGDKTKARIAEAVKAAQPTFDTLDEVLEVEVNQVQDLLADHRIQDELLREALGADDQADLTTLAKQQQEELTRLREAEAKAQVAEHIEDAIGKVKYHAPIKEAFVNAIQAQEPKTTEGADKVIAEQRQIFDKLQAKQELYMKGLGVDVKGPVLEAETGYPEFARVSYKIMENLHRRGNVQKLRDFRDMTKLNVNEQFTKRYLTLYDSQFKHHLAREAQLFQEAETTADLNLPYSVMRTVMQEVWATLVALSVFDFDTTDQAPARIYFERHVKEAGATATITDEDFNSGAFSTDLELDPTGTKQYSLWIQLAHKRLIPGTVVVNLDGGGALITDDGTNYVVDYEKGRIRFIDGGSSDANVSASTAYEVDYQYDSIREGETADIQEAKTVLDFDTLEIDADRLAANITNDAIVFGQSQVGWDAVTRTLANLINQLRNKIDTDLFYLAIAAAELVANNSGGTWASATDPITELVEKIGVARVNVAKRYYSTDAVIASLANADRISNWDGFTAAGNRPDADLDAAGFVGRVKGMPLFQSANMSDSRILVVNRQLIMHRIFRAVELKGPFHVINESTNKMKAQERYYAEEYNGSLAPVEEKGSFVIVS